MRFIGLDHVAPDGPAVNFVRSVHQTLRADVGVPGGQRRIAAVAQGPVQLDRGIDDLVHHVRQEHLGDGVFLPQIQALFGLVGDMNKSSR